MKGMLKALWLVFCVVIIAYSLWRSPLFVLETAGVVFIGGGLFLTLFSYACAKWSMPRKATAFLPKSDSACLCGVPNCQGHEIIDGEIRIPNHPLGNIVIRADDYAHDVPLARQIREAPNHSVLRLRVPFTSADFHR